MRAAVVVFVTVLMLGASTAVSPVEAQRAPSSVNGQTSERSARLLTLRAEMAAVLVADRRYDDAIQEYESILRMAPRSTIARLGLAKALLWSGRTLEAEKQLQILAGSGGSDAVDSLMLVARMQLQPTASQAGRWRSDNPGSEEYRLIHARALARERQFAAALSLYDSLATDGRAVSRSARTELAALLLQLGDHASSEVAYRALLADDSANVAHLLGLARSLAWGNRPAEAEPVILQVIERAGSTPVLDSMLTFARAAQEVSSARAAIWLREAPGKLEYRLAYADALVREGQHARALAQYDSVLAARSSAAAYIARGWLLVERDDLRGARRDFAAAARMEPGNASALLAAGHASRWAGEFGEARRAYHAAASLVGMTADLRAAYAHLARAERPAVGLLPNTYGDPRTSGWTTFTSAAADNIGTSVTTLAARHGVAAPRTLLASVGANTRWLGGRARGASPASLGLDGAVSGELVRGHRLVRGRARAGFSHHPSGRTLADAAIGGVAYSGAWGMGGELLIAPAWPSLMSVASYSRPGLGEEQLLERAATFAVAGPARGVDVAASIQRSWIDDGNARLGLHAMARRELTGLVNVHYAGSVLSYDGFSERYWSPRSYVSQALGPELQWRRGSQWSVSTRLLPGIAWTTERESRSGSRASRAAFVVSAGANASRTISGREMGASLNYGRGRAGEYQRLDFGLWASVSP